MNAYKIEGYQRHQLASTNLPADIAFGETEAVARKRWLNHHGADCRITNCRQISDDEALMHRVKALANSASPATLRAMLAAAELQAAAKTARDLVPYLEPLNASLQEQKVALLTQLDKALDTGI